MPLDDATAGMWAGALWFEARGRLRLVKGDRAAAVADLRACGAVFDGLHAGPAATTWRSTLALALDTDAREERSLAATELEQAAGAHLMRPRAVALRALGLLRGGQGGLALLRESVATLDGSPARLERARSLAALGAALRRAGARADAREPLAAGLEIAHACGADRLLATTRDELRATGARPRRIQRTGLEALTPTEQRTARLVAGGRSNAAVAQELFVSLKTVETHLSHVYGKFGLAGAGARRDLAALLVPAGA